MWTELFAKNKYSIVILLVGFLGLLLSTVILVEKGVMIPHYITLLKHFSLLFIFGSLFFFFLKKEKNLLSSISLLMLLMVLFETTCFFLLGLPAKENKDFFIPKMEEGHVTLQMGTVPVANDTIYRVKTNGNDTVYAAHYSIDEYFKRITPGFDSLRSKHALFFGCSIAFGEGLNDDQTLAYNFQQEGSFNAYNFAYSGYGTNHMLARLNYDDLNNQVAEKDGVALYIFFWDHFYRSIGAMSRYTSWGHMAPYYYLDNGQLVRDKSLREGKFSSKIYENIYQLSSVKYFNIDFPNNLRDEHYDLILAMIKESEKKYKEQFSEGEFYVVIYPSYTEEGKFDFKKFKEGLTRNELKTIDLFDYIDYGPEYTFEGDGHPNSSTSKIIAEELYKRIENRNKQ